jgi:hypothetical protein
MTLVGDSLRIHHRLRGPFFLFQTRSKICRRYVEDMSKICRVQNACLVHVHDETACQPILTLRRLSRLGGSSIFVLTGSALEIERIETALCTKVGSGLGLNSTRLPATARPPYHSPAHKPHLLSTLLL